MEFDDKLYEAAGLQNEKIAYFIKTGNKIVYDFVKEKGLIITGGLAIDILLRSKGMHIYPDELSEFPDIDCISTDSVMHSQELAQILNNREFPNVSAINALHVLTRRVRCDNRVLADITYVPANIYKDIPFIELAGQKIIHPWYQHLDQHMLMSKPFIDPPKENILNRLKKDITRYNLLDEAFPITAKKIKLTRTKVTIPADLYPIYTEHNVPTTVHGLAAYAGLITAAKHLLGANWSAIEKDDDIIICEAEFNDKGEYVYDSILPCTQLLIDMPDDFRLPKNSKSYNAILDLIPERCIFNRPRLDVELWRFTGLLLSVGIGKISNKDTILPSIQYVLMYMLTMYFFGEEKESHLVLYCSLKKLLSHLEPLYDNGNQEIIKSPFFLPLNTIGEINISQSQLISLMRIRKNIGYKEVLLDCLPANFWPATSRPINSFDYKSCNFFQKGGLEKE